MDSLPSANNHYNFLTQIKLPTVVSDFYPTPTNRCSYLDDLEKRPPPKPSQPSDKGKTLKVPTASPPPPSSDLGPFRPPPKPPNAGKNFHFVSVIAAGVDVGSPLYGVFLWVVCLKNALRAFDEMPHKSLTFWNNIVREDTNVADTNLSILFTCLLVCAQVVYLDKFETTYSRNEPKK